MKRINFWLVLALFSMLCTTFGVVGCSDDDDENESSPAELLGTWIFETESEYEGIIASTDNMFKEQVTFEKDSMMTYDISYCGEHYSCQMKWYTKDGRLYYYELNDDEKAPKGVKDVIWMDYKVSDNLLEIYEDGKLLWSYTRVK